MLIDTHAHLNLGALAQRPVADILQKAKAAGVNKIVNVGADYAGSQASIALAEAHPEIYATVGVHPHDAQALIDNPQLFNELAELLKSNKVVAVGEIGLDYYRNLSAVASQKQAFAQQLELAIKNNLPVIIHNREADEDMLAMLREYNYNKVVVHCYSGDVVMAEQLVEIGCYISFTGNITFPKNTVGHSVVQAIPLEYMMLETDCPYLAPEPHRGKVNEPAYLINVAQKVAELKNITVEEVATVTSQNALTFFNLS